MQYHVFLSHAGEDKEMLARPLFMELARREILCFFDADRDYGLPLGEKVGLACVFPSAPDRQWPTVFTQCHFTI